MGTHVRRVAMIGGGDASVFLLSIAGLENVLAAHANETHSVAAALLAA